MVTLTAVVQDTQPPRVILTAEDLGDPPGVLTITRLAGGTRAQVRGAVNATPSGDSFLVNDNEAPFGIDVQYALTQTIVTAGAEATTEVLSNWVRLTSVLPWLTNPITGEGVSLTIVEWPELDYSARQSVLDVAGRVRPVVVYDVRTSATSEMVVATLTLADLRALRLLLAPGDIILVRPVCDAVEGDYFAVGDVSETRLDPGDGSSWRRLVTLDLTAVDQPSPALPAIGDTLADLADFVPGTLADIAATWPDPATLLTIAQTRLRQD